MIGGANGIFARLPMPAHMMHLLNAAPEGCSLPYTRRTLLLRLAMFIAYASARDENAAMLTRAYCCDILYFSIAPD